MSISQNVGAITHILSRFLSNPTSMKISQEIKSFLAKIPNIGPFLTKQGHKMTESIKNLVSTAPFFEQFGLSYIGPIDGHDLGKLVDVLFALKNSTKPILLHVLTTKGKGMATAIDNPTPYHGCKPFDKQTGLFHTPSLQTTFPQIFGKHLLEMARKDAKLIAVTPAMTAGSCLDPFIKEFPDRCLDVGIAEGHCVTFCGGLAHLKKTHVVCSIYATFLQRALDNLFHDVCLQNLPVVFAIDRAGISGPDGSTHHGIYDISFLQAMPGMIISQPRNGHVLKELLESCFSWGKPSAIRYPNMVTKESDEPLTYRAPGEAEILVDGEDVLIIGLGVMALTALEVAENLRSHGILATVVDPVFVKPLDRVLFSKLISSHRYVVTLEEHSLQGGFATALGNFMREDGMIHDSVINFGIPDVFVEQGSHQELMKELGLTADEITSSLLAKILTPAGCP